MRLRYPALVALTALTLGITACGSQTPTSGAASDTQTGSSSSPTETPTGNKRPLVSEVPLSGAISHTHGVVAVDEETVLAGTHEGLVRISTDGVTEPVGDVRDDFMGMTGRAGGDLLATSGHPGAGSDLPNPVGYRVSDDGGLTWETRSLEGQVDFHALTTAGDAVVGYPGGDSVLVSDDGGRSWNSGAAVQPAALATSGDRVLATTREGLQVSTDGGRSFEAVPDAPLLVLISAGAGQHVAGLDTTGALWRSADAGATWHQVAGLPTVEAIGTLDKGTTFALGQDTLYVVGSE